MKFNLKQSVVVVAVDLGNYNIKLVTSTRKFIMKNNIDKSRRVDTSLTNGNNTFNVEYCGEIYTVGDGAEQPSTRMEGKNSKKHLIALLVSLTTVIDTNSEVKLVIGESLNVYFDQKHKESMKNNFIGKHDITVNNKKYEIFISDLHILPESVGHKLLNYQKYINNKVSYTIDLGSSTVNYGYYEGLIPVESKSAAYPLGMHNLISNIGKSFARNGGPNNCSSQQILEYINFGSKNEKLQQIIDIEINKQFDKLELLLQADGVKLEYIDEIEFCGGMSITLEKYIKSRYNNAYIVKDPLTSNVDGFYKFAQQKFNR